MTYLHPATFIESLVSFFRPRRLDVQVRTELLENGDFRVEPLFFLGDSQVNPAHLTPDTRQRLLGRFVQLDARAKQVLDLTKGRSVRLAKSKAADLLDTMSRKGVIVRNRDGRSSVQIKKAKPDVSLTLTPQDSLQVSSQLVTNDGKVVRKPKDVRALRQEDGWHSDGDDLIKVELTNTSLDEVLLNDDSPTELKGHEVPHFLENLDTQSRHVGEIDKSESLQGLSVSSVSGSNSLEVDGDDDHITVSPRLTLTTANGSSYTYDELEVDDLTKTEAPYDRVDDGWIKINAAEVENFGQACEMLAEQTSLTYRAEGVEIPKLLNSLTSDESPFQLSSSPWNVYYTHQVKESHRLCDQASSLDFKLNIVESDGKALLQLDPIYNHERFRLTHTEVEHAVSSGDEWVRRHGAWVRADDEQYSKVTFVASRLNLQRHDDGYSFPAANRDRVVELFSTLGNIQHSEAYAQFLVKLHDFEKIDEVDTPSNLRSTVSLRSYQHHGLNWLAFLHKYSLNGILADDMGLGKTLQTITVIERARELSEHAYPALIICPTSVMYNWKSEIDKFLQKSETVVYHGSDRNNRLAIVRQSLNTRHAIGVSQYVITSYGTARRDCEALQKLPWLYVVVDEGHNIKNPDAQQTRAIKTIPAQNKLVLTGTPIQNKLEELWSLFDFLMPGYLGTRPAFRSQYSKGNNVLWETVKTTLQPKIRPFYLRRLKTEVAQDLPSKNIIETRVQLSPKQVQLYKQAISTSSSEYKKLVEALDKKTVGQAQAQILAVLTQLRNICNYPQLNASDVAPKSTAIQYSGKLACLMELMEEIVAGDHRALLFSQSTAVLNIVQHHLSSAGYRLLRIDGATSPTTRLELAESFNNDENVDTWAHCFLLSTKAAGTGLNLIGADTVIFYDHDWNPANDNQAMDRAYRIGQTKPVTVYRLISKGTIEEKILERQEQKQSLADFVISPDEDSKDISKEELLSLFELDET